MTHKNTMHHFTPTPPRRTPWRDILLEATATAVVFALIASATWLFCWSFFIPFHARYAVGTILVAIMAKWAAPLKRR